MTGDRTGPRVVVTGGTRGVGRATVLAFAEAGATVVACSRHDDTHAHRLRRELSDRPGAHSVTRADVTVAEDVALLAAHCEASLGGVDVLVNNVGVDGRAPVADLDGEEWRRIVGVNLTACHRVTQALLPLISSGGAVINLGASVAARGRPGSAHYTAAKAGVIGLTRSLCKEFGPHGIRVNTVAPGVVADPDDPPGPPALQERLRGATALGRLAAPDEVAAAVLFLAGSAATYITGITLYVDGGM